MQKTVCRSLEEQIKICLIHGLGQSSDECKDMEEFVAKCVKGKRNKYHGNYSIPGKKINRQMENNAIISNMVDEILLNETQKVSAARKA